MAKQRTLEVVERDLKRVKRAEKKLRSNYNHIHRYLAKHGGIDGLPKKGEPEPAKPPKLSVYVRHQREISKSLKICLDELRTLTAEKAALELQVRETTDAYAL